MNRKLLVFFSLVFFLAGAPLLARKAGFHITYKEQGHGLGEVSFKLNSYTIKDYTENKLDYCRVECGSLAYLQKEGFAELPVINTSMALLPSTRPAFQILQSKYHLIKLKHPLLPALGEVYRSGPMPVRAINPDSQTHALYPHQVIEPSDPFILRDVRGVSLSFHPFQYDAKSGTLKVFDEIIVRMVQKQGNAINPLSSLREVSNHEVENLYSSCFINYKQSQYYKADNLPIKDLGDLMVIYTSRDAAPAKKYMTWKQEKGYKVIDKLVPAGTNPKTLIKEEYEKNKNLLYAQIFGEWTDVQTDLHEKEWAPMDPMLGCVAGNDHYPDVIIGRFSALNAEEADLQVNKTINYEKNPDMNGDWYSTAICIGSHEGGQPGKGDDGEADWQHIDIIKQHRLLKFTYTKTNDIFKEGTNAQLSGYINEGAGLINYTGHGDWNMWGTPRFKNAQVEALTNGNKQPFIISVACSNARYHIGPDCFAEVWMKHKNGGAIAILACSIKQPWNPPMIGQDYMNDALIGGYNYEGPPAKKAPQLRSPGKGINTSGQRTTVGSIAFNGLAMMYTEDKAPISLKTMQTWVLFGDSTLQLRTAKPKKISLSNVQVPAYGPFTTTVRSDGRGEEHAVVAITQNNVTCTGITDENGFVSIPHALAKGPARLVVTGFNLETQCLEIELP